MEAGDETVRKVCYHFQWNSMEHQEL
jgi:hypothetical protein